MHLEGQTRLGVRPARRFLQLNQSEWLHQQILTFEKSNRQRLPVEDPKDSRVSIKEGNAIECCKSQGNA